MAEKPGERAAVLLNAASDPGPGFLPISRPFVNLAQRVNETVTLVHGWEETHLLPKVEIIGFLLMLEEEALVGESALVEWCFGDNGRNLRALEAERRVSRHHPEQSCAFRDVLQLRVELHFVPMYVYHPLAVVVPTRPECCSVRACVFKPEVEREADIFIGNLMANSLLSELGEFGEAQVVDPGVLIEEGLQDSLPGALVREHIDVDSELILKEVETIRLLEGHIGEHVNGVHPIASELHGQRWVQTCNLGEVKPRL